MPPILYDDTDKTTSRVAVATVPTADCEPRQWPKMEALDKLPHGSDQMTVLAGSH